MVTYDNKEKVVNKTFAQLNKFWNNKIIDNKSSKQKSLISIHIYTYNYIYIHWFDKFTNNAFNNN